MKLILVAGTRPNSVKVAPIIRAVDKHNTTPSSKLIEPVLVRTGQHYDYEMSQLDVVGDGSNRSEYEELAEIYRDVLTVKET